MSKIEVDEVVNQTGDNDSGFDLSTNDVVAVKTANTERMRIDSSGKVGVGTTSGTGKLTVQDNSFPKIQANYQGTHHLEMGVGSIGCGLAMTTGHFITINHQPIANAGTDTNLTERFRIGATGSLNVTGVYNDTTSSSANVNVHSDGHIRRSTSSRKYKNTINDATHGLDDLLKLRSVTYKGNNDGDSVFGGLIAEEVHDVGLTEFVQYDDDNKPDALAYGNMVALCIKAIQELSAKNDALEAKVTALEGK